MVNADFDEQSSLASVADRIADELTLKLKKHYPLRATVVKSSADTLVLDVGHRQGAQIGMLLQSSDTALTARIVAVAPDQCTARVQDAAADVAVGARFQASP